MRKNLIFLFSFSLAKGIVFLAPLLLADILTGKDFGVLEYSLAGIGMLLNAVMNLGVQGAYPYFIIRKKMAKLKNGFSLHPLWLTLFFIGNQIIYFSFKPYGLEIYLAINISYIIANQMFFSTKLKSHSNIFRAVFLDAGIYILLLFFIIGYYLKLITPSINNISVSLFFYGCVFVVNAFYRFIRESKKTIFNHYKKILKFSIHLLISSLFLFLLTVSGRILSKHFFGYEATGIYGFYFRLSAIVVMIYQVISIRYFKELYTKKPKILDHYFSLFYFFIFVLSIIIYFIYPYLVPSFSEYFVNTYPNNKVLFFVIFCQMTFWIASALQSNIVDREGLSKVNNLYFLGLFILSIVVLYLYRDYLTLLSLTFILYSLFFMANITQLLALRTKKIIFKKSLLSLTFVYIASCLMLILIS